MGADVTRGLGVDESAFASYSLTRLHYRYTTDTLGEDLVFKKADPVVGGRGVPNDLGALEETEVRPSGVNNFQGRYVILHPWEKELTCSDPVRGRWGGPDGNRTPLTQGSRNGALSGGAPQAGNLPRLLAEAIDELDVEPVFPLYPFEVRQGGAPADPPETSDAGPSAATAGTATAGTSAASAGTGTTGSGDSDISDDSGCACHVPGAPRPLTPAGLGVLGVFTLGTLLRWLRRR